MAATAQLIVRMDPAEKQRVAREAKRSEATISDYVRAKLFNDEASNEELALQQALTDLGPTLRKALNAIDTDMKAITRLRVEASARAANVAARSRQELSPPELLAVADRLQLRPAPARRKTR